MREDSRAEIVRRAAEVLRREKARQKALTGEEKGKGVARERVAREKVVKGALDLQKAREKARRAREKAEKKARADARLSRKRKLEDALAEKMKAQQGVKKKLPVRPPPLEMSKVRGEARKKATIGMYFNSARNKGSTSCSPSDPISSESGASDLQFLASGQVPEVITVSDDTRPPASSSGADSDELGASLGAICLQDHPPLINLVSGDTSGHGSSNSFEEDAEFDLEDLQELALSDDEEEEEGDGPPPGKKQKKRYDSTRKFQTVWAVKLPWAEGVLGPDGVLEMVKCTVCSEHDKKPCIMGPKWDTLVKHEGSRKAVKDIPKYGVKKGDCYIAKDCRHRKNMRLHMAKQPKTILQQVVTSSNRAEKERKKVQFATLFQILSSGRPVLEYQSRQELYRFLQVPNNPSKHWSTSSGWEMADYMYEEVKGAIKNEISTARFVAMSADEVTTVDNGSWISVHAYIVKNWVRVPYLVGLKHLVDGATSDNLTVEIVKCIESGGGLDLDSIASKLLCFGADGVSAFQGAHTGVVRQLKHKFAPFLTGQHCCAHKTNLALRALSTLPLLASIEVMLRKTHAYFKHSPKRHLEFVHLAEVMETKALKLLKQVATRWVSLLEPMRRLLTQYHVVLAKMADDVDDNKDARVRFFSIYFLVNCFKCYFFLAIKALRITLDRF